MFTLESDSFSHSLPLMRLDWCDSGCGRCLLKTSRYCYNCWVWSIFWSWSVEGVLKLNFDFTWRQFLWWKNSTLGSVVPSAIFNRFWMVASILLHGAHQLIFIEKHGSHLGVNTWANWLMSSFSKTFHDYFIWVLWGFFSKLTCSTQENKFNWDLLDLGVGVKTQARMVGCTDFGTNERKFQ